MLIDKTYRMFNIFYYIRNILLSIYSVDIKVMYTLIYVYIAKIESQGTMNLKIQEIQGIQRIGRHGP